MQISSVDSCVVVNNTFINNAGGLGLYKGATNTSVARNTIRSGGAGIKLYKAGPGNKIYLNNINNTKSVVISRTTASQFWNSTEPIEYVCPTDGMIHKS